VFEPLRHRRHDNAALHCAFDLIEVDGAGAASGGRSVRGRGARQPRTQGVPEPVTLYGIVRASGGGRRAGQRHLTPLVGRDEEIAMLMRRWERARQGDGQLLLIMGEPDWVSLVCSRNFTAAYTTRRTPGPSGAFCNSSRTRRSARLPNGAARASAASTSRLSGGSRNLKTRFLRSSSIRGEYTLAGTSIAQCSRIARTKPAVRQEYTHQQLHCRASRHFKGSQGSEPDAADDGQGSAAGGVGVAPDPLERQPPGMGRDQLMD
jgi:hypothetical protein